METLSKGSDNEIHLFAERLLELNGYDTIGMERSEIRRLFTEIYHLVYSIRVIIGWAYQYIYNCFIFHNRNIPGFRVTICGEALPLNSISEEIKSFLNKSMADRHAIVSNDDKISDDEETVKKVKKNKRKRGKG